MSDEALAKNFDFSILENWKTYVSATDKTALPQKALYLVKGSQNVYKTLSGTVGNRCGMKRRGDADTTYSPISSEFVWNTSWGATLPLEITKGTLRVEYNGQYYTLLDNLIKTRYVFDKWWNQTEQKDRVLFVKGDSDLQHWSGGIAEVSGLSGVATSLGITAGGANYEVNDVLTIVGGTTDCTLEVTAVDSNGAVTAILILTGGSGYTTGAGKLTTGGSGTGCTIEIVTAASPSSNTLTKRNVGISWQQAGFSTTSGEKKIMIGGVEYTYTGGESTPTLTGVTPSPAAIADGTVAIQSVLTESSLPSAGFNSEFIKVINNQVYIGSYTSRLCYISENLDFTNYTVPTPRVAGSPELLTLDGSLNGIGVRQGKAHISYGSGEWAVISFEDYTVGTTLTQKTNVDVKPVAKLQAAYAHEFIATVGDSLIYLAKDNQLRLFGDVNNAFTPQYPSLSQEICTELSAEDFTGGALKCIGEYSYLTAPTSGKVYLYQNRQSIDESGTVVAERLWHSPMTWSITRVDDIGGVVYGYSNANPQVYQLWDTGQWHDDSPSDEAIPYTSVAALAYKTGGRRQGLINFDKNFTEGYIDPGSKLYLQLNYNYKGAKDVSIVPVHDASINRPAYLFTTETSSMGDASLGDNSLGDETAESLSDESDLTKFKSINMVPDHHVFEYQQIYYSTEVDSRWELLAVGTNMQVASTQQASFIINKLRK